MQNTLSSDVEADLAEDLLVLSMFKEAAEASKVLLDRLMYCAKSKKVEVRKRAAFVWIQAEFASKGLENSWQYLQQVFQVDVSLDVVTVW